MFIKRYLRSFAVSLKKEKTRAGFVDYEGGGKRWEAWVHLREEGEGA